MRIDTGELYFADCRQDVIINQTDISGISRNTPFIMSVNSYILFKEFFQRSAFGNLKFPDGHFILYFFFPFFSILLCWKCFRCLTFLTIIILNSINHRKFLSTLSYNSIIWLSAFTLNGWFSKDLSLSISISTTFSSVTANSFFSAIGNFLSLNTLTNAKKPVQNRLFFI